MAQITKKQIVYYKQLCYNKNNGCILTIDGLLLYVRHNIMMSRSSVSFSWGLPKVCPAEVKHDN